MEKTNILSNKSNLEFLYGNGVITCNILEETYISIEFLPTWQDEKSFNSAEYDNILKINNILKEKKDVTTKLIKPHDITNKELAEFEEELLEFLNNQKSIKENTTLEQIIELERQEIQKKYGEYLSREPYI